jgi:hypothetical protein
MVDPDPIVTSSLSIITPGKTVTFHGNHALSFIYISANLYGFHSICIAKHYTCPPNKYTSVNNNAVTYEDRFESINYLSFLNKDGSVPNLHITIRKNFAVG